MLAVHFGAGNIGRGFIGGLLVKSGFEVCFADVNDDIVAALNKENTYTVHLAMEPASSFQVNHVRALNSVSQSDELVETIASANVITTAVGPNILARISPVIRAGLRKRMTHEAAPLNIIACENMIGGSEHLRLAVLETMTEAELAWVNEHVAFPNAAVDRIVPIQKNVDLLAVSVEPYYEWVIDQSQIIGDTLTIEGATFVSDLLPYIERKLFTVNAGHAVPAYMGYLMGIPTIMEAMKNREILDMIHGALKETGDLLIAKYGFDASEHARYVDKIISRFQNPYISDEVVRVARGPIRKLSANDRLVSPALQYFTRFNRVPEHLAHVIALALRFDFEGDDEAVKLQKLIEEKGFAEALHEISGIAPDHPISQQVMKYV